MTPLSDALTAAQRRALAALEKAYVAGNIEGDALDESLRACGISDPTDIAFLLASLDVLREWGAAVPAETNGQTAEPKKATPGQIEDDSREPCGTTAHMAPEASESLPKDTKPC